MADAVRKLDRAVGLLAALPDPYNEGKVLTDLGQAHLRAGNSAAALAPLTRALTVLTEEDSPTERAVALQSLSVASERNGDRPRAVKWLTDALSILESQGDSRADRVRERLADLTGGRTENDGS
jgi:tetratricopeptide (TPR) repeat protein